MKSIFSLCAVALLSLLASCQNDGNIGDLYGQWQITETEVDGHTATHSDIFLSFQNDCVFGRLTGTDAHYADKFTGSFRHVGDSLSLHFYVAGESADVIHSYLDERFLFTGDHANLRFGVRQLDGDRLILTRGADTWVMRSY